VRLNPVQLWDAIHDLAARGYKKILINLADISYIDSWGIGEFVSCLTRFKNGGGSMKLLKPSKRVRDLLLVTKTAQCVHVFDDEASAVSSF
jgi:anti-sigma B factor antagonist